MPSDLEGATALVTGAGSGIGRTLALRLAEQGVAVAVLDLKAEAAAASAAQVEARGGRARALCADVADSKQVGVAVATAREALGPTDYLVNLAGIAHFAPVTEIGDDEWQRMLAVHLGGTFYCCRAVLPEMLARRFGRIVNMASIQAYGAGFGYIPPAVHYAAAKAGIIGFTRALAREVGPQGILVNAVAATAVDTPFWRGNTAPGALEARRADRARVIPLGRIGRPEDVADTILYLLSPASSYMTGDVISLTGGELMP
jgi:NAD(P)-dependent dehydrogenase (short-subunit alcohol dehydrogenase family)